MQQQNPQKAKDCDCTRFHCKFDACDVCRLDKLICNGGDGEKPGFYCRHYSDEVREQLGCSICGVAQEP